MYDAKSGHTLFKSLLERSKGSLTDAERVEIEEYMDAGEWGLALSTAIAIYVEEKKRPSEEEISLIRELSTGMSRDPAEAEARLRAIE